MFVTPEKLRRVTSEARALYAPVVQAFENEKSEALSRHIDKCDFGCQQANVRDLVALITGEQVVQIDKGRVYDGRIPACTLITFDGTLYMITGVDGDGDYYVADSQNRNIVQSTGNRYIAVASFRERGSIATEEQVEAFIEEAFS